MKKKSVKTNYIYNAIYQIFAMIIILITTPYVANILGAEQIGIYSYTYSITMYFVLFGSLGISLYAQREIAYCQNDIEKRSKIFFEILFLKLILMAFTLVLFYFLFCVKGQYSKYYMILIIELIANGLDIIWLFQGMEDFKKIVIRNIIAKSIIAFLIFALVKNYNDLWKYVLLYSLATLIGNLTLWYNLSSYIKKVKISSLNLLKHIRPTLILFIPQIAIQIYTMLDKTMLGIITNDMAAVGIYQKSQELAKLGLTIVTAFGTVIFPRMANCFINNKNEELKSCLKQGFAFIWIIALPIMFGFMSISKKFVPWFLGGDFQAVINLLVVFSTIILIIGLNNVIGMQYLIATKQQKFFSIAVAIGAFINVLFNFILIGKYSYYGAVIATILAEFIILVLEFYKIRKELKNCLELKTMFKCLISSILMGIFVFYIGKDMQPFIQTTIVQVVSGVAIYFTLLIIMKEENIINTLYKVLSKIRGKINAKN